MASEGYERRIGRYTAELADAFIEATGVKTGDRVLDVGCGSGALTSRLAERLGAGHVVGIDPSAEELARCSRRIEGVELHRGVAEDLPFRDDAFDAVMAQLVVTLMSDSPAGVREMSRVARAGAPVSGCAWDFAEGMRVLREFWDAARTVDPLGAARHDQAATRPYATPHALKRLWLGTGLTEVWTGQLVVGADYRDFDDLWEPMTIPDGGPGLFCEQLEQSQLARLRHELWLRLGEPTAPFRLDARAWIVVGYA